ncbi:GAF and ANTAR domain-containing protein [Tsukamurella sp. 8F]|uniref:GAF and ANTAR domain-containing protein n=1 Tax=unclassified Tsukamurella TaxID=2633480 RepID=UPI0023B8C3A9|nr:MULTISPECIES: GAF and ANTAR domain-containing protein [unclassified Tsukamurella]MDF0531734.1 GAF and ANTAR domain-containing protein [Tsukamurella sp. 8J]MDF0588980.1 GAF and ANTAR domain-containing protein [Tsukamurella sp. 8F]
MGEVGIADGASADGTDAAGVKIEGSDAQGVDIDTLLSSMTDIARDISRAPGVEETLASVTQACIDLIPVVTAASILSVEGPETYVSLAPTSDLPRRLDELQNRFREGACWDAATADSVTRSPRLRDESRWPHFAPAAVLEGVESMLSFRLFTFDKRVAALNLFADVPDAFGNEEETVGGMLATHAATAMIANDRQLQFRSALASRDIIGQAKGMLMERFDVDAVRAFELLTQLSSERNTRLVEIAELVVEKGSAQRRRS